MYSIQVCETKLSVFVDGVGEDGTPAATINLPGPMMDPKGTTKAQIGARFISQFVEEFVEV